MIWLRKEGGLIRPGLNICREGRSMDFRLGRFFAFAQYLPISGYLVGHIGWERRL
jgi:hypothetical protein